MKVRFWLAAVAALAGFVVIQQGCKKKDSPAAPAPEPPAATATFTPSPTIGSPTATPTATFTSTATATFTETATPTATFTETLTATPCVGAYLTAYPFTSDRMCWQTKNDLGTTTIDWAAAPPAGASGGALHAHTAYDPVNQSTEEFYVDLPSSQNLAGAILSVKVYVTSATKGGTWGGGIQPFAGTTGAYVFCGSWTNITGFDGWYTYQYTLSCGTANDVQRLGVQVILGAGGAGTGDVYIDDFQVLLTPPTATPTPPTTNVSTFDTTADGWTALSSGYVAPTSSGWSGTDGNPAGCFASLLPAMVNNDAAALEKTFGANQDWSAFSSIKADVKVDAYASYPGMQLNIVSGGDAGIGQCMGGCWDNAPTAGTWGNMNWSLANVTDKTAVKQIILRLNMGGSATSTGGNFSLDNVALY